MSGGIKNCKFQPAGLDYISVFDPYICRLADNGFRQKNQINSYSDHGEAPRLFLSM